MRHGQPHQAPAADPPSPEEEALRFLNEVVDCVLATAADELGTGADPLFAELWTSSLLGTWTELSPDDHGPLEAFVHALGRSAERARSSVGAGLLHLLSRLGAPSVAEAAAAEAARLRCEAGLAPPAWACAPTPRATRACVASDEYGDQDSIAVAFEAGPAGGRHAVVVLVDHNLYGVVKDAFVSDQVDEVFAGLPHGAGTRTTHCEPQAALARIGRALLATRARTDRAELCSEDVAGLEALLAARVGVVRPTPTDAAGQHDPTTLDVRTAAEVVETLVRDGGLPVRISPLAALLLLFDGLAGRRWPAKHLDVMPELLAAVATAVAPRGRKGRAVLAETVEAVDAAWPDARLLLSSGRRLAPNRRAVMDEIVEPDLPAWTVEEVAEALAELESARLQRQAQRAAARGRAPRRRAGAAKAGRPTSDLSLPGL